MDAAPQLEQTAPIARKLAAAVAGQPHVEAATVQQQQQQQELEEVARRRRRDLCGPVVRSGGKSVVQYGYESGTYQHTGGC